MVAKLHTPGLGGAWLRRTPLPLATFWSKVELPALPTLCQRSSSLMGSGARM
jgi:hypothetical protein